MGARLGAALAVALGDWLALTAAQARPALQYPLVGQLTGAQTATGSFSGGPTSDTGSYGIAVDDKTGQALVADPDAGLVYVFNVPASARSPLALGFLAVLTALALRARAGTCTSLPFPTPAWLHQALR